MTLEEKRRRITERRLEWLEVFFSAWLRDEGRKIYDAQDRREAKSDYEAIYAAVVAGGGKK